MFAIVMADEPFIRFQQRFLLIFGRQLNVVSHPRITKLWINGEVLDITGLSFIEGFGALLVTVLIGNGYLRDHEFRDLLETGELFIEHQVLYLLEQFLREYLGGQHYPLFQLFDIPG
jgi:hypothetical protein